MNWIHLIASWPCVATPNREDGETMRVLIMQENGRNPENRAFRECFSWQRAIADLGHDAVVWGLGHSDSSDTPDFDAFDLILNLENYDEQGWLPDLSGVQRPTKVLLAIDEHVQKAEYYERLLGRDDYELCLHATRDFVGESSRDLWFPNAYDPKLVHPMAVPRRAEVGFCGSAHNRQPWLDLLASQFDFKADILIVGERMVKAMNSYAVAFNRNIANDINYRSFEIIGCGVPLVTNFNPQYLDLGFRHKENCVFYSSEDELVENVRWLLADEARRKEIGRRGLELAAEHTYSQRAKALLRLVEERRAARNATSTHADSSSPSEFGRTCVSICIITNSGLPDRRDRQAYLSRLLKSIELAGFPESREVILAGAVPEMGSHGAEVLDLADLAAQGKVCSLRNAALRRANGDLVIHCDDDVLFTPGYWRAVSSVLEEDWDILCTRLLNPNGSRYWDWAAYRPGNGQTLVPYEIVDPHTFATGGHGIYRREVFDSVAWDESMNHGDCEEHDLAAQAREKGIRFRMCKDATVYLQYHHCDALAAVTGREQLGIDRKTLEFNRIWRLTEGRKAEDSTSRIPQAILDRVRHKLIGEEPEQKPPESISVLVCCHRYLQRFQLFAGSLARQDYPMDRVELVVANPQSPDGLSAYLGTLNRAWSATSNGARQGPECREVLAEKDHYRNRGYLIQRAFEQSSGSIVIGMDCDVILPTDFLSRLASTLASHPDRVVGVYRNFLTSESTDGLLAGVIDPRTGHQRLSTEDEQEDEGYRGVLGYCQAVTRQVWEEVGYPEEFDSIARSDVAFIERLQAVGVKPLFLKDVKVLHLHHQRDWTGTKEFL